MNRILGYEAVQNRVNPLKTASYPKILFILSLIRVIHHKSLPPYPSVPSPISVVKKSYQNTMSAMPKG
jgi:hypothetical protein